MSIKQKKIFNYNTGIQTFKSLNVKDKIENQKKDFSLQKIQKNV